MQDSAQDRKHYTAHDIYGIGPGQAQGQARLSSGLTNTFIEPSKHVFKIVILKVA